MINSNFPDTNQILKALNTLKEIVNKKSTKVLNENDRIVLQFSQKFVPIKREAFIHIVLPNYHPEHNNNEICLFVKDNDKYDREYDSTIQQYKDLLAKNNILDKIDIVPMKKLKLEYNDFEAKRRLSNSYEMFLADARIFRLLPEILGKHFIARKRLLTKVNFGIKNIKKEIEKAIKTVHVSLRSHGPLSQCTIGYFDQKNEELVENITEAIRQISLHLDHGFSNIRSINIKTNSSLSVPLYVSLDELKILDIKDKIMREKPNLEDEVSTVLNGKVRIGNNGRVVIIYDHQPKVEVVTNASDLHIPKKLRNKKVKVVKALSNDAKRKVKSSFNKEVVGKSNDYPSKRKMSHKLKVVKKIKLQVEDSVINNVDKTMPQYVKKSDKKFKNKTELKKKTSKGIKIQSVR